MILLMFQVMINQAEKGKLITNNLDCYHCRTFLYWTTVYDAGKLNYHFLNCQSKMINVAHFFPQRLIRLT
jgi:hypothetical protein